MDSMDSVSLNDVPSSSHESYMEKKTYCKSISNYRKELKSRSLNMPSILLLVYFLPTAFCFVLMSNIGNNFTSVDSQCAPDSRNDYSSIDTLIMKGLFFLIPFCGWLSDTKIGRGDAIYLSLWLGCMDRHSTTIHRMLLAIQFLWYHTLFDRKICISWSSSYPFIFLVSISVNCSISICYRSDEK